MLSVVIGLNSVWIALTDVRLRRISNLQTGLMLLVCGTLALSSGQGWVGLQSLALASAIGVVLFVLGVWGGGDTKLYAAMAPLFSPTELLYASVWMMGFGGLLAVFYLIKYRLINRSKEDPGLPYGLAILLGMGFQLLISALTS
ncbi:MULTISPECIES: prepilin peptidase [Ferrimonas]|uniref:A24 family peptidase n=1 Tax=Ferrimonas TaxID=44011 RepID=UPI000423341A|nr:MULTISPECIES: prepilin peptidase [Ferrimonas]USD38811.1 prepilin peptidase [Ferrimonas sp. SCSIO 43195]